MKFDGSWPLFIKISLGNRPFRSLFYHFGRDFAWKEWERGQKMVAGEDFVYSKETGRYCALQAGRANPKAHGPRPSIGTRGMVAGPGVPKLQG